MAKLNHFKVSIDSITRGPAEVLFSINGNELGFINTSGGTGPGERFCGEFAHHSFTHELALIGPQKDVWEIAGMEITYCSDDGEPWTRKFGGFSLDGTTKADISSEPPLPEFEV